MKHLAFVAVLLAFGPCSIQLYSQSNSEDTGAELYGKCQSATRIVAKDTSLSEFDYQRAQFCMGYLLGMKDMQTMSNAMLKADSHTELSIVCVPYESTVFELMKVVTKYLDDHPTELHQGESIVVLKAFRDAYPCPTK